jgi:hypothetical protein
VAAAAKLRVELAVLDPGEIVDGEKEHVKPATDEQESVI